MGGDKAGGLSVSFSLVSSTLPSSVSPSSDPPEAPGQGWEGRMRRRELVSRMWRDTLHGHHRLGRTKQRWSSGQVAPWADPALPFVSLREAPLALGGRQSVP